MIIEFFYTALAPFRAVWYKFYSIRAAKGRLQGEVRNIKSYAKRGKESFDGVNAKLNKAAGGQPAAAGGAAGAGAAGASGQPGAQPAAGQPGAMPATSRGVQPLGQAYNPAPPGQPYGAYGAQPQIPPAGQVQPMGQQQPQAQMYPQQAAQAAQGAQAMQQTQGAPAVAGGAPSSNPPIIVKGFWVFKKKHCSQCEQLLDNSWDSCPYCAQIAAQAAVAPAMVQALKTQAFVLDQSGSPGQMQLLGWIVPLQGPQRGELFTLGPNSSIGTDPSCTVCLNDKFMSSKHAEIRAEAGLWILRDGGSTNGTYVNNRRVDRHELVDNDFIKFGSAMVKFKSL